VKARYVAALLAFPFVLIAGGTTGYMLVEGWPFADALYMTVITVTTVGYGETHPLSAAGRWFTMALALGGIFALFFATSTVIALALSGDLARLARRFLMDRKLSKLNDHVIVCGSGRMGRLVAQALVKSGLTVVLVDLDEKALGALQSPSVIAIAGDASSDELLTKVGITRARAFVAALGGDADNVFLTLSARALNPDLFIVARAVEEATEAKLVRAGANRVVAPFSVGGYVAANAILHPTVLDSLDLAQRTGHLEVQVEEVFLRHGCAVCGRPLRESRLREKFGVLIVALRRANSQVVFNPPDDMAPAENDTLVVMGRRAELDRLERSIMVP